jgi:uncharacterized cupredoxin-like copper-binding protein
LLLGLPGVRADGGSSVVAVHAVDFAYQGVPSTLPAGETRISFTNDGKGEGHEMTLFRINDGVTESFDQILAEDEAEANKQAPPPPPKMTFFAATGSDPGQSAKMDLIGNLPAGRYGMACFISSGDDANATHYKKGMKAEFTVQ